MIFLQIIWLAVTDIFSMHIHASCKLQCGQHHKRFFIYLYNIGPQNKARVVICKVGKKIPD